MTSNRSCGSCGASFVAVRGTARFCSDRCRKRAQRGHVLDLAGLGLGPGHGPGLLVAALRAELEEVGRADSFLGRTALSLAARVEASQGTDSGVAALNRELRATVEAAKANTRQPASVVEQMRDELAARRAKGA